MGQTLTIELTAPEYAALEDAARAGGETPGEWAAARLREQLPTVGGDEPEVTIPPDVYELLVGVARQSGRSIEEVTGKWVRAMAPKPRPVLSPEEREAANQRLRQHIVHLGHATGADNESIDADLAREYGDDHADLYSPTPDETTS